MRWTARTEEIETRVSFCQESWAGVAASTPRHLNMMSHRTLNQIPSKVAIPLSPVVGRSSLTCERTGVTSLRSYPLRQEGDVYSQAGALILTPSGVKCMIASVNMELLTEFAPLHPPNYKRGTPVGIHSLTMSKLHSNSVSCKRNQNQRRRIPLTLKRFPEGNR